MGTKGSAISEVKKSILAQAKENGGRMKLNFSDDLHYQFFLELNGGYDHLAKAAPDFLKIAEQKRNTDRMFTSQSDPNNLGLEDGESIRCISAVEKTEKNDQWKLNADCVATCATPRYMEKVHADIYDLTTGRILKDADFVSRYPDVNQEFSFKLDEDMDAALRGGEHHYQINAYFTRINHRRIQDAQGREQVTIEPDVSIVTSEAFSYSTAGDIDEFKIVDPCIKYGDKRTEHKDEIAISYKREGWLPNPDYYYAVDLPHYIQYLPVKLEITIEISLKNGAYFFSEGSHGYLNPDMDPEIKLYRFENNKIVTGGVAPLVCDMDSLEVNVLKLNNNKRPIKLQIKFPVDWKSKLYAKNWMNISVTTSLYIHLSLNTEHIIDGVPTPMTTNIFAYNDTAGSINVKKIPLVFFQWGCLDKDAQIRTSSGLKKISEISIGDEVLDRNGAAVIVRNIMTGPQDTMLRITTDHGEVLSLTHTHTVCTPDGYAPASQVQFGDTILAWDASAGKELSTKIVSIEEIPYNDTTYNLIFDNATIFVANGLLVGDYTYQQLVQPPLKVENVELPHTEEIDRILDQFEQLSKPEPPAFVPALKPECPALHYFAVKALAKYMDFTEKEAQTIAEYCQFLGDNATAGGLYVEEIPEDFNNQNLFANSGTGYLVPIIPTAMKNWYNHEELNAEIPWFDTSAGDERVYNTASDIVAPFHYYHEKDNAVSFQPKSLQMAMEAVSQEAQDWWDDEGDRSKLPASILMKIGMYLHILADTKLHEEFYAIKHYKNLRRRTTVLDSEGTHVTDDYPPYQDYPFSQQSPETEFPIFIEQTGESLHVPNVKLEYYFPTNAAQLTKISHYQGHRAVINSNRFERACLEMARFLSKCSRYRTFDEKAWNETGGMRDALRGVFQKSTMAYSSLQTVWKEAFSSETFSYSAKDVYNRLITGDTTKTTDLEKYQEFFDYIWFLYNYKKECQDK